MKNRFTKCQLRTFRLKGLIECSIKYVEIHIKDLRNRRKIIKSLNSILFNYVRLRDKFDKKDVMRILTDLGFHYSKPEVDQWIWEIDEDLDGCVNRYEFTLMYKRYQCNNSDAYLIKTDWNLEIYSI